MSNFMKLAFKNVFRNRRRTAITGLVLVFGTTALILAGGFMEFTFRGLSESTIHGPMRTALPGMQTDYHYAPAFVPFVGFVAKNSFF